MKGSVGRRSQSSRLRFYLQLLLPAASRTTLGRTTWSGRWELNPRQPAWKAGTLPLSYARLDFQRDVERGSRRTVMTGLDTHHCRPHCLLWWAGKDSNLGSRWQQIYSLPPLATWVPARNLQRKVTKGPSFRITKMGKVEQASPRTARPSLKLRMKVMSSGLSLVQETADSIDEVMRSQDLMGEWSTFRRIILH